MIWGSLYSPWDEFMLREPFSIDGLIWEGPLA
jgi:hypothetical protein